MSKSLNLLISNSAMASLLILLIFLFRYIFRNRLHARLQYALWLIVAIRLIVPFNLQLRIESKHTISQPQFINNFLENKKETYERDMDNPTVTSEIQEPLKTENNQLKDYEDTFIKASFLIWIVGVISIFLLFLIRYALFCKRVERDMLPHGFTDDMYDRTSKIVEIKKNIPVYVSKDVNSPCIIGILNPVIILTEEVTEDIKATKFALIHEMVHYKQKDNLVLLLVNLICALYWFNPLVWLVAKVVKEDAELSCDSRIIQKISEGECYSYCLTLLTVAGNSNLMVATMSSGGKRMKNRIDMILKPPKKLTAGVIVAMTCLFLAIGSFVNVSVNAKSNISQSSNNIVEDLIGITTLGNVPEVYELLHTLPNPNDNYKINTIAINNEDHFKLLYLGYEFSEGHSIGGISEGDIIRINKNALDLFSTISDLKEIRISYIDKEANSIIRNVEAPITLIYQRDQITGQHEDLNIYPKIQKDFWESWGKNNVILIYGYSEILSSIGIKKDEYMEDSSMAERILSILGDYDTTWDSYGTRMYRFSLGEEDNNFSDLMIMVDEFGNLEGHGIIPHGALSYQ